LASKSAVKGTQEAILAREVDLFLFSQECSGSDSYSTVMTAAVSAVI